MGRIVSPHKDEIANLKTPLEPGERLVLDLFEQTLCDEWEIYVQPHLNGALCCVAPPLSHLALSATSIASAHWALFSAQIDTLRAIPGA